MKFIETKRRGRKPRLQAVRSKQAATTDLMDKLTKSLKAARKEKKVA
jgi:non-homologous end joining protein Ku